VSLALHLLSIFFFFGAAAAPGGHQGECSHPHAARKHRLARRRGARRRWAAWRGVKLRSAARLALAKWRGSAAAHRRLRRGRGSA